MAVHSLMFSVGCGAKTRGFSIWLGMEASIQRVPLTESAHRHHTSCIERLIPLKSWLISRTKPCKVDARRARTREHMPLADDQHSSTHSSSHNRRRHADWCLTRNQNKTRADALARPTNCKPSQPPPFYLGLQPVDWTKDLKGTGRTRIVPIAWSWSFGKLRPGPGGGLQVRRPPNRYHTNPEASAQRSKKRSHNIDRKSQT